MRWLNPKKSYITTVYIFTLGVALLVLTACACVLLLRAPYVVKAYGLVDSGHKALVRSQLAGIISRVAVREGQVVSKGQVLYVIGGPDVDVERSQVALDSRTRAIDWDLARKLYAQGLMSKEEYLQDQAAWVHQRRLEQRLQAYEISSPTSGVYVSDEESKLKVGTALVAGQEIGWVFDASQATFEMQVPEYQIRRVRSGEPIKVELYAFPKEKFGLLYGTVKEIIPQVQYGPTGSFFKVIADLDLPTVRAKADHISLAMLRPNLGGIARILSPKKRILFLLWDGIEDVLSPRPAS